MSNWSLFEHLSQNLATQFVIKTRGPQTLAGQPRWLSGLKPSRVHSLMIARRSSEKLGSNPGQGSKGINFSGWHGLDMSVTVTKRRYTPTNQTQTLSCISQNPIRVDAEYIISVVMWIGANNDQIWFFEDRDLGQIMTR